MTPIPKHRPIPRRTRTPKLTHLILSYTLTLDIFERFGPLSICQFRHLAYTIFGLKFAELAMLHKIENSAPNRYTYHKMQMWVFPFMVTSGELRVFVKHDNPEYVKYSIASLGQKHLKYYKETYPKVTLLSYVKHTKAAIAPVLARKDKLYSPELREKILTFLSGESEKV